MPAIQRGQAYRLGPNRWGLRWYDPPASAAASPRSRPSRAALAHYRDVIEPELLGETPRRARAHACRARRGSTSSATPLGAPAHHRHAARAARARHRRVRRGAAARPRAHGRRDRVWQATLPERSRYALASALRQALDAAVRWGYMSRNPAELAGRNRQPPPRPVRAFTSTSSTRSRPSCRRLPAAAGVRRRDRAAARGVAGARAPRRRPPARAS